VNGRTDVDFIEVLSGIVREARALQNSGRLLDPVSRTEVSLLEHQLRVMEARMEAAAISEGPGAVEHAGAVAAWSRELQEASAATRGHSRRLRKDLYRARTIEGSGPD